LKRILLAAALLLSQILPAAATDLQHLSGAERDAFRAEVRAYLLENPELLMEAIAVLEERQTAAQESGDAATIAAYSADIFEDKSSWAGGNPDGDVTIVEFLDYRCGYCRRAHPEVAELIARDPDIRLIVKEFPILGEESMLGSRYALAVRRLAGDAAYKQVADTLIMMRGSINPAAVARLSKGLGLDHDAVSAEMENPEIGRILSSNRALAQVLQISGTPSFIFGNMMVRGYVPLDTMEQIVARLRGG